jgi:hypothetical protein
MNTKTARVGLAGVLVALVATAVGSAMTFSSWSSAQLVANVNTAFGDGCPIQSPDGLSLYMASNRDGYTGPTRNLDIWVARRGSTDDPWGAPENLGPPINSPVDDFCPTPIRGGGLFFVSRAEPVACGTNDGDIYFTRYNPAHGWSEPLHLACASDGGPNSTLDEMGPSYVEIDGQEHLYFSSGPDIYMSERGPGWSFGVAQAVTELNSTASDIQPNVRKDGREVVFASNRGGSSQDIWVATREDAGDPWSAPAMLGEEVNTASNETRPSLSWDGRTLYFGRAPFLTGPGDIYLSTREKLAG